MPRLTYDIYSPWQRGGLCVIGVAQIGLSIAIMFLWINHKIDNDEIARSLEVFAAIINIAGGILTMATAIGKSMEIMAVATCVAVISGIISISAATAKAILDDKCKGLTSCISIRHVLILLPFLCSFLCVMEILTYRALKQQSNYQSITEGDEENPGSRSRGTGSTSRTSISNSETRPPAYSNPPPYTEQSPLRGSSNSRSLNII